MADKAEFEIELIDDVTRPARKAESSLQRLKKTLNRFSNSTIGRATAKLANITKTAVMVGGAIAAAIGGGIAAATVGMVDFAQRSRMAFGLLAKSGEVPEQLFQRSIDLAQKLGLDIKDTTKQIQKFRALQFNQGQAEELIKMGSDLRAINIPADKIQAVFTALGQIKGKGKLQGDELLQLAEAGVSIEVVFASLARRLGVSIDEVQKRISAGAVKSSDALNSIGEAILFKVGKSKFGEAGEAAARSTLSGMAGILRSKMQGMFLKIADKAGPAIEKTFGKIFTELDSFMSSDQGAQLIERISKAVSIMAKAVEKSIPLVKAFLGGFDKGATETWKQFSSAFASVTKALGGSDSERALRISEMLGKSFGRLAVFAGVVTAELAALTAGVALLLVVVQDVTRGMIQSATTELGNIIRPFKDAFNRVRALLDNEALSLGEKGVEIGKALINGFNRGLFALAMAPINHVRRIVQGTIDVAKNTLGQHSPSKVFEDIGKNTAIGFSLGLQDLPTQNIIHSTLGNDNGMSAPVRGNLAGGEARAIRTGGGSVRVDVGGIHIAPPPGMTSEQAKDLGRTVGDEFFKHIHAYFDDIVLEEAV